MKDPRPSLSEFTPAPTWLPQWGLQLSERRVLLFIGDLLGSVIALLIAFWLWTFTAEVPFTLDFILSRPSWLFALALLWVFLSPNFYNLRRANSLALTAQAMLVSGLIVSGLYVLGYFLSPPGTLPRLVVFYFFGLAFIAKFIWRVAYVFVFTSRNFRRRVVIVGAGWAGQTIARLLAESDTPYEVVAAIDDDRSKHGQVLGMTTVVANSDQLLETVKAARASEIILAITGQLSGNMFQALLDCHENGIDITRMPTLYEELTGRVPVQHLGSDWVFSSFVEAVQLNTIERAVRRIVDIVGAWVGLMILLFILPPIALAVWLEDRGPLVYRQLRVGRGGREFAVYKFRTMVVNAEADGRAQWATPDDPRITRIGRFLRRTRLDEWPQFWNVLIGDMSLVGPRPERPEFVTELEQIIPFYRSRLLVKPGITGWAQVNYRYGASVEDALVKLQYDLYYVKNRSLWLDLLILWRTVAVVLRFAGQ